MLQEATHKTCSFDEKPWLPGGMKDEQCQSCCSYLSVAQCWTESIAFVSSSLSVLLLIYIQKNPGEDPLRLKIVDLFCVCMQRRLFLCFTSAKTWFCQIGRGLNSSISNNVYLIGVLNSSSFNS